MDILFFNLSWMTYNLYLALLPILFLWLAFHLRRKLYKLIFGFLWLIYLPNSIYIFADLSHLIEQWVEVAGSGTKLLLLLEYTVLEVIGLTAFIYALHPVEHALKESKHFKTKRIQALTIIFINFLLGFAMVLGRVERVNSWDILLAPARVIEASINTVFSIELMLLAVLFGLFANFFYFLFRTPVMRLLKDI